MDPDYNWTIAESYTEFARVYLEHGHIRILHHAGSQRNRSMANAQNSHLSRIERDYLPSWAADWRYRRPSLGLGGLSRQSFTTATKLSVDINSDPRSKEIRVAGIILDVIDHCHGSIDLGQYIDEPLRYATHDAPRASIVELESFYDNHRSSDVYCTGEENLTAFARTIMADGSYIPFKTMFPHWHTPQSLVMIWRFFSQTRINRDDTINFPQDPRLPNAQTGELTTDRTQIIHTAWLIVTVMFGALDGRCFFITKNDYIGMAPALAQGGDVIAILAGAETPFVLRPEKEEGRYSL